MVFVFLRVLVLMVFAFASVQSLAEQPSNYEVNVHSLHNTTRGFVKPVVFGGSRVALISVDGKLVLVDFKNDQVNENEVVLDYNPEPYVSAGILHVDNMIICTINSHVYAVDINNMKLMWFKQLDSPVRGEPFVIDNENIAVLMADGTLMLIKRTSGDLVWKRFGLANYVRKLSSVSGLVRNGVIFTPVTEGRLVAVTPSDGSPVWQSNLGCDSLKNPSVDIRTTPSVSGGRVFVANDCGKLFAFDVSSGKKIWSIDLNVDNLSHFDELNGLFVTTMHHELVRIDPKSGRIMWKTSLTGGRDSRSFTGEPVYFDNGVWTSLSNGSIIKLNTESGEVLENISVPRGITHPLVVHDSSIYAVTDEDSVLVINVSNKQESVHGK